MKIELMYLKMSGPAYGKLMYKPFDKIDEGMLKYM